MEVIIMPTAEKAEQLAAAIIADALRQKPNLTLGLATGATMENLYHKLADMNKKGELDFSLCKTFNLDEYVGLAAGQKFLSLLHELPPLRPHQHRQAQHAP